VADFDSLCARKAALLRELADLEAELPGALAEAVKPRERDEILNLRQAAAYVGEPERTVRDKL
jgi:hypothetical protein